MRRLSIPDIVARARQLLHSSPEEAIIRIETVLKEQDHIFDNEYADLFLVAGEAHRVLGDYKKAVEQIERALQLFTTENNAKVAECLQKIGTCYIYLTDLPTGLRYLLNSLTIREEIGSPMPIAHSLNALGVLFMNADDYEQALNYFLRASERVLSTDDHKLLGPINNNIGEIHFILADYTKALEHFRSSLVYRNLKNDKVGLAYTHNNMGNAHVEMGGYEAGLKHLFQALELREELNIKKEVANTLLNIGIAYDRQGSHTKALTILRRALRLAEREGSKAHVAAIHKFLGITYLHQGSSEHALKSFELALSLSRELSLRLNEYQTLEQMALLYEDKKLCLKALRHLQLCHSVREDILGAERQRAIVKVELRAALDALRKEKEFQLLRAEKAEKELELKSKQLSQNLISLIRRNAALKHLKFILLPYESSGIEEVRSVAKEISEYTRRALNDHEEWQSIEEDFAMVHSIFLQNLQQQSSSLTPSELRICVLTRMNFSVDQIADLLFTSAGTVKQHRNHIRKKLNLHSKQNLQSYLISC